MPLVCEAVSCSVEEGSSKGNCEGSQKVKMRMWRVVQEFTHIHVQKKRNSRCHWFVRRFHAQLRKAVPKEIAKDLKRKMRIWRAVQEFMHIQEVKQRFCCTNNVACGIF